MKAIVDSEQKPYEPVIEKPAPKLVKKEARPVPKNNSKKDTPPKYSVPKPNSEKPEHNDHRESASDYLRDFKPKAKEKAKPKSIAEKKPVERPSWGAGKAKPKVYG